MAKAPPQFSFATRALDLSENYRDAVKLRRKLMDGVYEAAEKKKPWLVSRQLEKVRAQRTVARAARQRLAAELKKHGIVNPEPTCADVAREADVSKWEK